MLTEEQMTARKLTEHELANVPPIQVGPGHERNPFLAVTGHPVGLANAKTWTRVYGWDALQEADAREPVTADPLDALGDLLAVDSVGWHRAEGPHGLAIFPHTAQDVAGWEERALVMHAEQVMITLPDKPSEPLRTRPVAEQDGRHAPPLKFEDSEASRRLRGLSRGD